MVVRMFARLLVFLLIAGAASAGDWFGRVQAPPRAAYPFALTDPSGNRVRLADLKGKVLLIAFGFTHCPGICPAMLAQLTTAVREAGGSVEIVFISVDPDRDTPQRMGAFTGRFAGPVLGLTGTRGELAAAAKGFRATAKPTAGPGELIDHTTDVTVVDRNGRVRLTYRFDQLAQSAAIAADLRRLLAEG